MHHEQSERLAFLFRGFGVVSAVGAQDSAGVQAVELPEPPETLVDVHVVDEEIGESVQRYTDADKKHPEVRRHTAIHVAKRRRDSKHEEKTVVFFKKPVFGVLGLVMVFVPVPQNAVHDIFVCEPGHKFHAHIRHYGDENIQQRRHTVDFIL